MDELSPNQFQRVYMNDIPFVEYLLTLKILQYDINIIDGNIMGKTARRSEQKKREYCASTEIQQPHLLPEQHYCRFSINSMV